MPTSWPRPATDPFTSSPSPPAACTWSSPWSRRSTGPAACSTSSSARPGSATTGSATSWLPRDAAEPKPDRRGLARAPVHERRFYERRAPAELALVEGDRPPQPGFEGGRRLEEILPVERVAHLQTEDVAGRQPSWRTPGRPNRVEQVAPEIGGDVLVREQLEAHLAGVAGACHDHRPAVVLGLDAAHERQPAGGREESRYHVRRHRPLHRQKAPVLVVDQVQRLGGFLFLEPPQDPQGVRRVRYDEVPVLVEAVDDQVLDHAA